MSRFYTDEALILRTYNVGETDRFCIVLTRSHGRLALRAPGVRKLLSRRGRGLLPLHSTILTWEERRSSRLITGAECLQTNEAAWRDPRALGEAMQGVELLLKLTEEDTPIEDVYHLFSSFLRGVRDSKRGEQSVLFHLFTLKLLKLFGALPSASHSSTSHRKFEEREALVWTEAGGIVARSETSSGQPVHPALHHLLQSLDTLRLDMVTQFSLEAFGELDAFVGRALGSQLGSGAALVTFPLRRSISSGVTPTCQ